MGLSERVAVVTSVVFTITVASGQWVYDAEYSTELNEQTAVMLWWVLFTFVGGCSTLTLISAPTPSPRRVISRHLNLPTLLQTVISNY